MSDAGFAAADVVAAARRIRGIALRTPLERSGALSEAAGTDVFLKLEGQQRTGSFKLRGAANALALLDPIRCARGVVTASAGNHGLGLSFAARHHGIGATVFLPEAAPAVKKARIAGLGAAIREVGGGYDDAHEAAEAFAAETGAFYVHAFSDPAVIAGQGTVGLEILQELPEAATLIVPVGGGGLIGGIGTVARALGAGARVVGVQSTETAAMYHSLRAGRVESPPMGDTLCDGLSGDIDLPSFELARRVADDVVLVSEAAVRSAIRRLFVSEGIVAEGSAATVAAALWEGVIPDLVGPVAAVVSGRNIDARRLARILAAPEPA